MPNLQKIKALVLYGRKNWDFQNVVWDKDESTVRTMIGFKFWRKRLKFNVDNNHLIAGKKNLVIIDGMLLSSAGVGQIVKVPKGHLVINTSGDIEFRKGDAPEKFGEREKFVSSVEPVTLGRDKSILLTCITNGWLRNSLSFLGERSFWQRISSLGLNWKMGLLWAGAGMGVMYMLRSILAGFGVYMP